MKMFYLILMLLSTCVIASSQQSEWENYTFAYGLWDFDETDGFYWLSTGGGLVKISKADGSKEVLTKANSILRFNSVGPLCTDLDGNLWIGSASNNAQEKGLIKYDGENWESVELGDGFWSSMVSGIVADKNNKLWFGMGQEIACYDGSRIKSLRIIPEIMSFALVIKQILFDKDNNVWFLDEPGYIRVLKDGNFDSLKGKVKSQVLEQDTKGNFWISENNRLKSFSPTDNIHNLADGATEIVNDRLDFNDSIVPQPGDTILHCHVDKNNTFYIVFQSKLGILKNGSWQYLTAENSQFPEGNFHQLYVSSQGTLWANVYVLGQKFRIYNYDNPIWTDVSQELSNSGLHNNYITGFAKDDSEEMWLISQDHLLTNHNGTEWTDYASTNTSVLNMRFTTKYLNDSTCIWYDNSIIIRLNTATNEWNILDNRASQSSSMKVDKGGNIWWATTKGIRKYSNGNLEVFFDGEHFQEMIFDKNGVLYAGTLPYQKQGVLMEYKNSTWDTLVIVTPDNNFWVSSLTIDKDNKLWFGILSRDVVGREYGGGLAKYDGVNFTQYHIRNSDNFPGNSVVYVSTDTDNNIWIGTYGNGVSMFNDDGIVRDPDPQDTTYYEPGTWINYTAENSPLSGISAEKIIPDNDGNLWVYCQFNGITVIPHAEFNAVNIDHQETFDLTNNIGIYPNPASETFYVSFKIDKSDKLSISLYDNSGIKVFGKETAIYPKGFYIEEINKIGSMSPGIYFCEITIGNNYEIKKLIIE